MAIGFDVQDIGSVTDKAASLFPGSVGRFVSVTQGERK